MRPHRSTVARRSPLRLPGSLADLGHRKVGIGPSEALAACESIRIFL